MNTAKAPKTFISIDGESIKDSYVLLGCTLPDYYLLNKKGITSYEALQWLIRLKMKCKREYNSPVFVWFYGEYDVNYIIKDLSFEEKNKLFDGEIIEWKEFTIEYKRKKFFRLKYTGLKGHTLTIYDVASFFKSNFIKVCEKFLGYVPEIITEGKSRRVSFRKQDLDFMIRYNNSECVHLSLIMDKISEQLDELEWNGNSYYGPSAISKRLLGKTNMLTEFSNNLGYDITNAIDLSYYGGRIEAFKLGTFKNVYDYDINSAYPYAMLSLPLITKDRWYKLKEFKSSMMFSVYYVEWDIPEKACYIGPFPHRIKSRITFPLNGSGFYWYPEVRNALKKYKKYINIHYGYGLEVQRHARLKELVHYLYNLRKELKANGDDKEYIVKIAMNAMYGSFAQSVGRCDYQCLAWAGYITSTCRALIMSAIGKTQRDIIGISTDGILSRVPLEVKLGKQLGEWTYDNWEYATVIMSGLYNLYNTGQDAKVKNGIRGYKSLQWDNVLDQLSSSGKARIKEKLFFGFKYAKVRNEWDNYLHFAEVQKEINPARLTKRNYEVSMIGDWRKDNCESTPIIYPRIEESHRRQNSTFDELDIDDVDPERGGFLDL